MRLVKRCTSVGGGSPGEPLRCAREEGHPGNHTALQESGLGFLPEDLGQRDRDAQSRAVTAAVQLAIGNLDQTLAACASVSDEARAWVTGVVLGYGQRLIKWAEENGRGHG